MMGDSASEPNIIANDSGLCVYIRIQPNNTAQSGNVLLRITPTIAHRYETSTDFSSSALYIHSILLSLTVDCD